jgi:muramidase (phage lysozyme)
MTLILETIRTFESGGNYSAENPDTSASGAYQFLDTTWDGYGG